MKKPNFLNAINAIYVKKHWFLYGNVKLFKLAKPGPSGPGSLRAPRLLRPFGPGHVLGFEPSHTEFWGVALYGGQKSHTYATGRA